MISLKEEQNFNKSLLSDISLLCLLTMYLYIEFNKIQDMHLVLYYFGFVLCSFLTWFLQEPRNYPMLLVLILYVRISFLFLF